MECVLVHRVGPTTNKVMERTRTSNTAQPPPEIQELALETRMELRQLMDELPDEVLAIVAGFLASPRELGRLSQVASRFHDAVIRQPEAGQAERWSVVEEGARLQTQRLQPGALRLKGQTWLALLGHARLCRDSTIVRSAEHAVALANWLPAKHPKLELLYRASEHEFGLADGVERLRTMKQPETLSERGYSKEGATLTVIRDTRGYVFGGFTDMEWDTSHHSESIGQDVAAIGALREQVRLREVELGDQHEETQRGMRALVNLNCGGQPMLSHEFLFALRCHAGLEPTKMGLKDAGSAKFLCSSRGLRFGRDLYIQRDDMGSTTTNWFSAAIGSTYVCPEGKDGSTLLTGVTEPQQVAELEIFRVQDQHREASVQDKLQDGLGMLSTGDCKGAIDAFMMGLGLVSPLVSSGLEARLKAALNQADMAQALQNPW